MDEENNESEGKRFAKELGKTFLLSFALGAGSILGMTAGVYVVSKIPKIVPNVQVNTTPTE